jgi:Leucine-rich repeat (LRR) protein
LIAEAREAGARRLSFDREDCRGLDRLPPEISGLDALRTLDLDRTQVSDLSPLAGLTALTTLSLSDTQVSDLSPSRN